MLETSKDILYLVISFCVLWTTVFLCWMFYYVMRLLRNTNQIVEEFRVRLQALTEAINYIRGKVEHMSGLMTLLTDGAAGLAKKFVTRKAEQWGQAGADKFDEAAKDAVSKAVAATAKGMRGAVKKMKR
ncbi:MAG: hypothetical protein A2538_00170 [Candidatus Magasanikbacteria bacterium RIFOXYD2_FULL_41_14]|uniref:Uncharacterized protein n=1 Tax=Candidatus Magasanikbacteria bacterium RIFOXYD2_FULL_41_14 TaxID=1798709 RepID=A0A1F6PEY5_9BACT|nr:MAG: hypothetical protein A2538_00170 [Candidatus Magasanikbacteria bacterium RIFOXYD2_FULL_41_14]